MDMCFNLLVIAMLIQEVFYVKRTNGMNIDAYTITVVSPGTCVRIPLRNVCDFSLFPRENCETSIIFHFYTKEYKMLNL